VAFFICIFLFKVVILNLSNEVEVTDLRSRVLASLPNADIGSRKPMDRFSSTRPAYV